MLHSGMGPTHVNSFLTALNVPPVSENALINRQQEVGPALERVAKQSCQENATAERAREAESRNISQEDLQKLEYLDISVSYDMMWMKTGRAHNSLTGDYVFNIF